MANARLRAGSTVDGSGAQSQGVAKRCCVARVTTLRRTCSIFFAMELTTQLSNLPRSQESYWWRRAPTLLASLPPSS
jgi:hypothetical protein